MNKLSKDFVKSRFNFIKKAISMILTISTIKFNDETNRKDVECYVKNHPDILNTEFLPNSSASDIIGFYNYVNLYRLFCPENKSKRLYNYFFIYW